MCCAISKGELQNKQKPRKILPGQPAARNIKEIFYLSNGEMSERKFGGGVSTTEVSA
jgi:hypothetical protein